MFTRRRKAAQGTEPPVDTPFARFRRAFLPLQVWFVISVFLLGRSWLQSMESTTVLVYNINLEAPAGEINATLSGDPFESGKLSGFGWKRLKLEGEGVKSASRWVFLWPGRNDIGVIDVERTRGDLTIAVSPGPELIHIKGPGVERDHVTNPLELKSLPTGRYEVTARFGRHKEERVLEVSEGRNDPLQISASLGAARITSEPSDAEVLVFDENGKMVNILGNTPTFEPYLPAGAHALVIAMGESHTNLALRVEPGKTNSLHVVFEFAEVSLVSVPEGATVREGRDVLGQTPLTLTNVTPGEHTYRITLDNHSPEEVVVNASGAEPTRVEVELQNLVFARALSAAGRTSNVTTALEHIETALAIHPESAEALALKEELLAKQRAAATQALEEQRASNLAKAERAFNRTVRGQKDAELFETFTWTLQKDLKDVQGAIVRMCSPGNSNWTKDVESPLPDGMVLFRCAGVGEGNENKLAVVLLSEPVPGETAIHGKFLDYVDTNPVRGLFGRLATPQLVPLHPQNFRPEDKQTVESRRQLLVIEFKERLQKEID